MEKQYVMTERAHFMCPNMHFGMLLEVTATYDAINLTNTLKELATAHPFLRAILAYEDDTDHIYYKVTEKSQIQLVIQENEDTLWDDYNAIAKNSWNLFQEGLLKVYVYPKSSGMKVLFIAHHLLADGRGMLGLSQEFADCYVKGIKPSPAKENLMKTIDELPKEISLSGISKLLVKRANKQWKKENHKVTFEEYDKFAVTYGKTHPVMHNTYTTTPNETNDMKKLCKDNGFSMNDLLLANMFLKTGTKKIIIAADIRNELNNYVEGSLGNYATAMSIVSKSKTTDLIKKAKEVHQAVHKSMSHNRSKMLVLACYFEMEPTLLDAAAISALGSFNSKAGTFVGQKMFGMAKPTSYSITNLGAITNDSLTSLLFIPPASPAAKYTLGVVTLNQTLRACSSEY